MGTSCKANPEQILSLVRNYFEGEAAKLLALRMSVAEAEQRAVDAQYSKDRTPPLDAKIRILSADPGQSGAGRP